MDARGLVARVERTDQDGMVVRMKRGCTVRELLDSWGLSRVAANRLSSRIRVTGSDAPMSAAFRLETDEEVRVPFELPRDSFPTDAPPADVLWQDRLCLAALKPCGLLVHGDGTEAPTLTRRVGAHLALQARSGTWRVPPVPQALQRLDVQTSGIVWFSLTKEFQSAFDALVASHAMEKCYLAVVEGTAAWDVRDLRQPIARDRHDARRMRVGRTGKPAHTRVACLARSGGRTLVACRLFTGRRHQIRVHLSHAGFSIVGDELYGRADAGGLMLHAHRTEFTHPVTHERVMLQTDWPARFTKLFSPCRLDWSILDA